MREKSIRRGTLPFCLILPARRAGIGMGGGGGGGFGGGGGGGGKKGWGGIVIGSNMCEIGLGGGKS